MRTITGGYGQQQPSELFPIVKSVSTFTSLATATHYFIAPDNLVNGDLIVMVFTSVPASDPEPPAGGWAVLYLDYQSAMHYGSYSKISNGTESGVQQSFTTRAATTLCGQVFQISSWFPYSGGFAYGQSFYYERGVNNSLDPDIILPNWGTHSTLYINVLHSAISGTVLSQPTGYTEPIGITTGDIETDAQLYTCTLENLSAFENSDSWEVDSPSGTYLCYTIAIRGAVV